MCVKSGQINQANNTEPQNLRGRVLNLIIFDKNFVGVEETSTNRAGVAEPAQIVIQFNT